MGGLGRDRDWAASLRGRGWRSLIVWVLSVETILSYIKAQDLALHHASQLNLYF